MRISIDCGHGQNNTGNGRYDPGACANGLQEHTIVRGMGYRLRDRFEKDGHEVLVQESGPYYTRDDLASRFGADVHVSLHCDAASSPTATGVTVFVNRNSPMSTKAWAEAVGIAVSKAQRIKFRGLQEKDFGTLAGKTLDCLVEMFFLTNPSDVAAYQKNVDGVEYALAKTIPGKPQPTKPQQVYYWVLIHAEADDARKYRLSAESDGNAVRLKRTSQSSYKDIDDVIETLP